MLNNTTKKKEKACNHNVYIKGLCGNCGARLDPTQSTSVSMIHSVPELKVSVEYAKVIGNEDQQRLIEERKLVLLVDLDQTILHTTHEEVKNDPNVHSFTLWPGHPTYYTKLRPHLEEFLKQMSKIYELHIFTFGCRKYAHKIASLIDPDQKYFGNRILSRDESVDQYSKRGNLNNLFPCGDAMVCIIDDRSDVWRDAGNLIQVKPYSYFKTSISDGANRRDFVVDDDESIKRDVDKLEALLGLDDSDEDCESGSESQTAEPRSVENDSSDTSDSGEGNLKKKTKTCDSDTEDVANDRENLNESCDVKVSEKSGKDLEEECSKETKEETDDKEISKVEDDHSTSSSSKVGEEEEGADDDSSSATPPEPVEDRDDHLLYLPHILNRIHEKWYMELDEQRCYLVEGESYKLPDIKDIIKRYLRKKF